MPSMIHRMGTEEFGELFWSGHGEIHLIAHRLLKTNGCHNFDRYPDTTAEIEFVRAA
jgi:hypothetical protein